MEINGFLVKAYRRFLLILVYLSKPVRANKEIDIICKKGLRL